MLRVIRVYASGGRNGFRDVDNRNEGGVTRDTRTGHRSFYHSANCPAIGSVIRVLRREEFHATLLFSVR